MLTLLPWHEPYWTQIARARQTGRMPHGLLLKEPAGTGAFEFAQYLGASLLCLNPQNNYSPCGACKSCLLFEAGNHSDMHVIQPEETSRQIKVEQIRTLIDSVMLKSQYEGYRLAIIHPADAMNKSAANTLLKTLEEPPAYAILILVTQRPERLPITIRSRCQQISFQPDFTERARDWLAGKINDTKRADELLLLAKGAPLAALNMHENGLLEKQDAVLNELGRLSKADADPVTAAKQWNDLGAEQVMLWLLGSLTGMINMLVDNAAGKSYPAGAAERLQKLTNRLDLYKLMTCYDLLMRNYRLLTGQISYDAQGLLEEFIIHWQQQHLPQKG